MTDYSHTSTNAVLREYLACRSSLPDYVLLPPYEMAGGLAPVAVLLTNDKANLVEALEARPVLASPAGLSHAYTLPSHAMEPVWLVQSDEGLVPEAWARALLAQRQSCTAEAGGAVWVVPDALKSDLVLYWRSVHTLSIPTPLPAQAWQHLAQHLAGLGAFCVPSADTAIPFQTKVACLLNQMAHGFGHSPVPALKPLIASPRMGENLAPLNGRVLVAASTPTSVGLVNLARQWQSESCTVTWLGPLVQGHEASDAQGAGLTFLSEDAYRAQAQTHFDFLVVHDLAGWSLKHVQGQVLQEALESCLQGSARLGALMQAGLSLLLKPLQAGTRLVIDQPAFSGAFYRHADYRGLQRALQTQAGSPVMAWAAWPDVRTWVQWPYLIDDAQVTGLLNLGLAQVHAGTPGVAHWPTDLEHGQGLALAQAWCCVLDTHTGTSTGETFTLQTDQAVAYQTTDKGLQALFASDALLQAGARTAQQLFCLRASREGWRYTDLALELNRYLQAVQTRVPQWPLREWLEQKPSGLDMPDDVANALRQAMPDQIGWDAQGQVFDRRPVNVTIEQGQTPLTVASWLQSALQCFLRGAPQWGAQEHKRRFTRLQWAENLLAHAGIQCLAADWQRAGILPETWQADQYLPTPEPTPELSERDARILALEQQLHYLQTDKNIMAERLAQATAIAKGITADVRRVVTQEVTADVSMRVSEAVSRQVSAAYESSLSWRVTRPLRKSKEWLNRLRTGAPEVQLVIPAEPAPGNSIPSNDLSPTGVASPPVPNTFVQECLQSFVSKHNFAPPQPSLEADLSAEPRLDYGRWVSEFDQMDVFAREKLREQWAEKEACAVLGMVCLPASSSKQLLAVLGDVLAQPYPHWRLVILVPSECSLDETCEHLMAADPRLIRVSVASEATWADGLRAGLQAMPSEVEYLSLWQPGSRLACAGLSALALALQTRPEWELVYADVDVLDPQGQRCQPHFKPDWNEALLFSSCLAPQVQNSLISGALWARATRWHALSLAETGSQPDDLVLAQLALALQVLPLQDGCVGHLPRVITHLAPTHMSEAGRGRGLELLRTYFASQGQELGLHLTPQGLRLQWPLPTAPALVSLIIPTRNNPQLLGQCVRSIQEKTQGVALEIIVVDNGSDTPQALATLRELAQLPSVRVLRDSSPFNYSALNNHAVDLAKGQWVALVNDDIEVREGQGQWLEEMLRHAARPQVGVVGAKLLYPNGTVQHAGVFLVGTLSWHAYRHFPADHPGHCGQALLTRNSTCLTAACIVVRKSIYQQVGGLDAEHLTIGWNDTDFCLKVKAAGYQNIWTPDACLIHHESATRGQDQTPEKKARAEREWRTMQKRWGDQMSEDPAYNPNLSCGYEDYSWAWPPRGKLNSLDTDA